VRDSLRFPAESFGVDTVFIKSDRGAKVFRLPVSDFRPVDRLLDDLERVVALPLWTVAGEAADSALRASVSQ
jgi:hypothetical protein